MSPEITLKKQQLQNALDEIILMLFKKHKRRYGYRRIYKALITSHDYKGSRERLRRRMIAKSLKAKQRKAYKVTTDSDHDLLISPNILNRAFDASKPNQKWVGDITYINRDQGWLYLATVIDLYSRKVVGWSMQPHMKVEEKLRDKPIATANLAIQTAIRVATQQYYSFREHTEKHIETKLKSGTIDASIERTLNDIEELLVNGKDNDERYKGVKKWASFKTKRLTDANAEIEKSLKSKGLSQLYAFETFDAEGNNVGGRSKLANLRLELAIKNQDISITG